ncbi:MAG: N-acetyltransferase, partial [Solirubrobacterales bacterium]
MADDVETTISKVTEIDLSELLPMMRAYCEFYETNPRDDRLVALSKALLGDPGEGVQYIARGEDRAALGFATVFWSWDTTEAVRTGIMHDLFVVPEARGRAVGRKLIEACR